jgi:hypothetical protein
MPTADTGFLSSYASLHPAGDGASRQRRTVVLIDPAQLVIEAPQWRADPQAISAAERAMLTIRLEHALRGATARLPPAPAARAVRIRAAVTRVVTVSPAFNTVASLMLVGPVDRGGAAVEVEAIDALTGEQLAAINIGYFAPMSELKARFSALAPAALAMDRAAAAFAPLLEISENREAAAR